MSIKKNRTFLTVTAILAFSALILGVYVAQHIHLHKKVDLNKFHGTFLSSPRSLQEFSLIGTNEKTFNNQSLQGHWTLVFFGFTSCGYVCPTTMTELGKMYRLLEEKQVKPLPEVIMISLDPERDSLSRLTQYVKAFNPHFQGARGDREVIKLLTREMGVAYAKIALKGEKENQQYDIEHTGSIMLINPQGELSAFFTTPHHADLLAEDYLLLVS